MESLRRVVRRLGESEQEVLYTRMHVRALLAPMAVALLGATIAGTILTSAGSSGDGSLVALVVAAPFAAWAAWRILRWRRSLLVLTTWRLLEIDGVVRLRVTSTPLSSLTEVTAQRSLSGRLLGYGYLVLSSGDGARSIGPLPRPHRLAQSVAATLSLAARSTRRPPAEEPPGPPSERKGGHPSIRRQAEAGARARPTLEEGFLAGRYRLGRPLASGGMGTVFAAVDQRLHREVAVKLLHSESIAGSLDRFRREALWAAALNHPNIAAIFDYGEEGDRAYIVMELVRGGDLASIIEREGSLDPRRAGHVACDVLDALQHAHESGVVHRDIKPGNVILRRDGRVKVTDFGIARAIGASRMTEDGIVLGSAPYVSPEQIQGEAATESSDVYATGILLYEMLVGAPPFGGGSPLEVVRHHLEGRVPAPSSAAPVSSMFDDIVEKASAREPVDRFSSAAAMAAAIERLLDDGPSSEARSTPAATLRLHRYDTPPLPL